MTKKILLFAFVSTFAAVRGFSQGGYTFDSLKAVTGSDKALIFTPMTNYGHKIYGYSASATKADMRFAIRANTPLWTDVMAVTNEGFVGIGTNFPVAKLSVYGVNAHDGCLTIQSASDSRFFIQEGENKLKIGGIASGTGAITVLNTGRVGVGEPNPVIKLSVYGSTIDEGGISFQSANDHRFYIQEGDELLKIGGLNWGVGAINVTNTGTVGIGTTTTGTNKLAVEGTIAARKIKVTQASTWPDFVFDSAYHLPALEELNNYVKVNKHLPDVPSASDVQKDGQDVGEMNRLLLQKVEELTLHLIKEHERNEKMEQQIKVLQHKMEVVLRKKVQK